MSVSQYIPWSAIRHAEHSRTCTDGIGGKSVKLASRNCRDFDEMAFASLEYVGHITTSKGKPSAKDSI